MSEHKNQAAKASSEAPSHLEQVVVAAVDSEATELELRQLVKACAEGDEQAEALRQAWAQQHQVQSAMQHSEASQWAHLDISAAVRDAVASESIATGGDHESVAHESSGQADTNVVAMPSRWRQSVAGFAVAASVAVVTVIGFNASPTGEVSVGPELAQQPAAVSAPLSDVASQYSQVVSYGSNHNPALNMSSASSAEDQKRLEAFMMRHAEHASAANPKGMMPMARVVSYPVEAQ